MTVAELIEELRKCNPKSTVIVEDNAEGCPSYNLVKVYKVEGNFNLDEYYSVYVRPHNRIDPPLDGLTMIHF